MPKATMPPTVPVAISTISAKIAYPVMHESMNRAMKIWGRIFPIINAYAWVVVLFVLHLPLACGVYEQEW